MKKLIVGVVGVLGAAGLFVGTIQPSLAASPIPSVVPAVAIGAMQMTYYWYSDPTNPPNVLTLTGVFTGGGASYVGQVIGDGVFGNGGQGNKAMFVQLSVPNPANFQGQCSGVGSLGGAVEVPFTLGCTVSIQGGAPMPMDLQLIIVGTGSSSSPMSTDYAGVFLVPALPV